MKKQLEIQKAMQIKERLNLDKVALIGRTFSEYEKIFRLSDFKDSNVSILDIGSGVSSFCAEACEVGLNVIAMDPIYVYTPDELEPKCSSDLELVINELNGVEHLYVWNIFPTKDHLRQQRERAYKTFLNHFRECDGKRYIAGELPRINLKDNQFNLIVSSHLLFLYDHIFDYSFHSQALKEMLRIASKEIRIFPLVNLYGKKSIFLQQFLNNPCFKDYEKSIERVEYEFIRGGNEFLRIIKDR